MSGGAPPQTSANSTIPGMPTPPAPQRTIWGLDPSQLHTRYWASNGVQVVRQGEPSEIVKHAEVCSCSPNLPR